MKKSRKIVLIEDESCGHLVSSALVIQKTTDGHYFMSYNFRLYEEDKVSDHLGRLFMISKMEAFILSHKKSTSRLFKNVLHEILHNEEKEIEKGQLPENMRESYKEILANHCMLVQPAMKKWNADIHEKDIQKKEAENIAQRKADEIRSQRFSKFLKEFREK